MKLLEIRSLQVLILLCVTFLISGCSGNEGYEPNIQSFDLEEISDINISYDEEEVTFYESDNGQLVIKEYMTENRSRYYARIKEKRTSISITEGRKPFIQKGFSRFVEVYLPENYAGNLSVTTTSGDIDLSETKLNLEGMHAESTAGTLKISALSASSIYLFTTRGEMILGDIQGTQIQMESTSGKLSCEKISGRVSYCSKNGDAVFRSISGSGTFKTENSGKLEAHFKVVEGDLDFYNKNDKIEVTLPQVLSFEFRAELKNGSLDTTFQENLERTGNTYKGVVGKQPAVAVKAKTNNGKIQVKQTPLKLSDSEGQKQIKDTL